MNSNFLPFFEGNDYFIDEKIHFMKFENSYKVYNDKGDNIGAIKQRLTVGEKILRMLVNKAILPFKLEIVNTNEEVQATITRGWTFWMSKIRVLNNNGLPIALIQQKFKFFTPTFHILDAEQKPIAVISGDWKAWNFSIADTTQKEIGSITKKWAGAMQEIFTSADKYYVHIDPSYAEDDKKIAIISTAITIDMVMKESK